ncbi:MAG: hypothetical protein E7L30_11810 [Lactococcus lactis]|nr:hypothetical protein [Eggerthella sp.]MDU3173785.1 hypothetical protein [Eggerthella sp.]MDU7301541.1 hypothetical protein [Lactococcus lactis]MDU7427136.1 hypothetical protein [Staphylococcus epidermidis]
MSDKVIMVYTVNDSSAFVFNQTLDNMKVIGVKGHLKMLVLGH